ncbi:probable RNA-dependent RNA polymerase 3 isoform X1 [Miscanthus floridulus]|uniref:probable RNA-dependent RNA polymerase 3 isoform X1 n=1 Tax=Miscanthus floridulus TaxID=154761 RepID=UPI003457FA6D
MIEDVPCKDEYGNIVLNAEGKPLIHTTGTGFISEDLAMKCPTGVFRGKASKPFELQDNMDLDENDTLIRLVNSRGCPTHIPLLMQSHMFSNGCVVKGTFLVDRRLPPRTIHIRPSMIKVRADPNLIDVKSFNSLKVISTSNRQKRALTSWFLIALLHYGGVPEEYFMKLLLNASDGIHSICHVINDALKGTNYQGWMRVWMYTQTTQVQILIELNLRVLLPSLVLPSPLCPSAGYPGENHYISFCISGDGQLSGDVLVYKYPGLHLGDIHVLTATYIRGLEDIVGNSKYAIFFPVSGSQAMASSFGGNMFWVSRNSELLKYFKPCQPRLQRITQKRKEQKNPQHYGSSLESALFDDFLRTRFTLSSSPDTVANCWLAYMDRLLSCEVSITEKKYLKDKMLSLVDAYNEALDDWKTLNKVQVPRELMVKHYPHFMEQTGCHSYHSKSALGAIYDEALSQIENRLPIEISFLRCFTDVEVSEMCMEMWRNRYQEYLTDRSLFLLDSKEGKNMKLQQVHAKYKQMLYSAAKFEETPRDHQTVFAEACAIYQIAYGSARAHGDVSKCGFAWNVAGDALCHLYVLKHGSSSVAIVRRLLQL